MVAWATEVVGSRSDFHFLLNVGTNLYRTFQIAGGCLIMGLKSTRKVDFRGFTARGEVTANAYAPGRDVLPLYLPF